MLTALGLRAAGGNYVQVQRVIRELGLPVGHFNGKGWRKGSREAVVPQKLLAELLVQHSTYQSFKLKKRLFSEGMKRPTCELCGWAKKSLDGRLPLELDHINGDRTDNRLNNLRILCPNCHSLQ